jgi:hypothetical protein
VKNIWNVRLYDVNRFASFYAESGNVKWSGNLWYLITNAAFNQCFNDDANCNRKVPFLHLDFKNADNGNHNFESMEITFGPGPGQLRKIGSVRID